MPGAGTRVLCLGNDLLADDAFGIDVAAGIRDRAPASVDVVETGKGGFQLLDHLEEVTRLIVVDTVQTGSAPPGTLHWFSEADVSPIPGGSPHYTGLFEALAVGRTLGMRVPEEVLFIAVEAADCLTVGGSMHPDVRGAIATAVGRVLDLIS
jgi:hydrogenase maturation protease